MYFISYWYDVYHTICTRVWYKCPVSCAVVHCEGGTKKGAFSSGEGLVCVEMMMPHNSVFFFQTHFYVIYIHCFTCFFSPVFFVLKLGETWRHLNAICIHFEVGSTEVSKKTCSKMRHPVTSSAINLAAGEMASSFIRSLKAVAFLCEQVWEEVTSHTGWSPSSPPPPITKDPKQYLVTKIWRHLRVTHQAGHGWCLRRPGGTA